MELIRLIGILLFLMPFVSRGQEVVTPDTVVTLEEVWIEASRREELAIGHPSHQIDQQVMQRFSGQQLAFLLARHSGMYLKSYGPGILATTTLRGGSAGHSALLWNGFNLQSPMHQQSDLSLLPVFFMDEVGIQHGGGSALWGSGAMGGAIMLSNKPPAGKGFQAMAGFNANSLQDAGQQLSLQYKGNIFSSSLKAFNRNAPNRYHYLNTAREDAGREVQKHASLKQWGLLQENYLQIGQQHALRLRWWWQDNDRNIPPALQQSHTGAFQHDEALRITGEWQTNLKKAVMLWRGGYFREELRYRDSINLESLSRSNTMVQEAEVRWQLAPQWIMVSGANFQHVKAIAREYSQQHTQNSLALFSSLAWQPLPGVLKAVGSLRQEWIRGMNIPMVPSVGISWKPLASFSLAANIGKNYRVPSLNDRYWIPGGNPDLLPESGWSQDLTATWHPRATATEREAPAGIYMEKTSLTGFHRNIANWIIWLPRDGGMIWTPQNVMQVQGYGLELRSRGGYRHQDFTLTWSMTYDHVISRNTKARSLNDASLNKQLIYVPLNRGGATITLSVKNLALVYTHQLTGRRYTNSDNTRWLDPYQTGDLGLSWSTPLGNNFVEVFADVINLWDQNYLVMAARPMPLRYFQAGINIHFFKNQ
ncbi:MAG: TonB-dependent receptor [Bacteroidales bacterium]